jgi:hypothetical protein
MIVDAAALARSARRLRWVTLGGVGLVAAAILFGCWAIFAGPRSGGGVTFDVDLDGHPPMAAAIVLIIAGALLIAALLQLALTLRAVERGAPFRTGAGLRRFAFFLFLALLAASLLPPLIQLAQRLAGTGERVQFSLSGEELLMLFVTGLLFFVARLLEAAQAVAEDHQQIV